MAGESGGPIPLPIGSIVDAVTGGGAGGFFGIPGGLGSFSDALRAREAQAQGPPLPAPTLPTLPGTPGNPIPQTGGSVPPPGTGVDVVDLLRGVLQILQLLGVLPGGGGLFGGGGFDSRDREAGTVGGGPQQQQQQFPRSPAPQGRGGGGGGGGGGDVPFLSLEGGGLFGTGITGGDIAQVIGAIRGGGGGMVLPGGAPVNQIGGMLGSFDLPGIDIVAQGAATCGTPFRPTQSGASAQKHLKTNPVTGRPQWFGPIGQPVLWSGDLAACKRVKKVAARARRAGGR